MSLFAGLPTPKWISPDEQSRDSFETAQQLVSGWQSIQRQKDEQIGARTGLQLDQMKQNLNLNQTEMQNQAIDQQTIPAWLQQNNTWDKRNAATDMPVPLSDWGMKTMQGIRIGDAQIIGKETMLRSTEDFTKRFHKLTPEFSSKIIQLPGGPNGQPSPQQWDALNAAELIMSDRDMKKKKDAQIAIKTEQETLAEKLASKKAADSTALETQRSTERTTRDSQKHQWVVKNIDHRYDLSAQTAAKKFTNQKNLAKFNQEATLIRSSQLSPEQQVSRMKDLETKYKSDFGGKGGFHDFQDDGTPMDSAMNPNTPTAPMDKYDTKLSPGEESKFISWKEKYAPNDSGADYDLRGAFKAGLTPGANGHWPDTFKKPNHETYSVESKFANQYPKGAGSWDGDTYVPSKDKTPVTLPKSQDRLVKGNIYQTKLGPAMWDGTQFIKQ